MLEFEETNPVLNDFFIEKARTQILYEYLREDLSLKELQDIDSDLTSIFDYSNRYQVIIYDRYRLEQAESTYSFAELLRVSTHTQSNFEFLTIDNYNVIVLRGDFAIRRLDSVLQKYTSNLPPQHYSPLDSFFISCGRIVDNIADLPQSYKDAVAQLHRRFFCNRHQHFILFDAGSALQTQVIEDNSYQDFDLLKDYTNKFVILIQAYNRDRIQNLLDNLSANLTSLSISVSGQKNWLLDLYLGIKEKIEHFYQSSNIPFISNSGAIQYILNSNYLYEIIDFLSAQFEMIMNSTGNFTRDSIIDVILNYIDHNYSENITLENISPIFGYNSSYLGKIFTEKIGISFHTYLDDVRIEKSKELLSGTKLQVYRIAKQVGYSNVDYFHIKFKKKTGISPATYRKQNAVE